MHSSLGVWFILFSWPQVALFPGTSQTVGGDTDRVAGDDVESSPLMPNDSVYDALVRVLKTIWTIWNIMLI